MERPGRREETRARELIQRADLNAIKRSHNKKGMRAERLGGKAGDR